MKKSLSFIFVLFLAINILGQDCPAEEIFFIQDGPDFSAVSSDLYAPFNATLAADNFVLDAAAEVNTVCWPGFYWYEGDGVGIARDEVNKRADPCDPGGEKNFRITYYLDNWGYVFYLQTIEF